MVYDFRNIMKKW